MKILKSFIKALWSLFLVGFLIYSIVLRIQGKSIKEEIFSWFDNTVTLASVMEDNNMTREEAFSYIIDTTAPRDLPGILEDMTDHVFLNARSAGISTFIILPLFLRPTSTLFSYKVLTIRFSI